MSVNLFHMKKFNVIIALLVLFLSSASYGQSKLFYRIRLDQDIDPAAQRLVTLGLEKASEAGADYVILDLDTYGGAVDAADSIRSAILRYDKPVLAFVNMQAASAGALISIACDSIYMREGSSIGAATVVDQTGAVMPDKYQSFMRGMMRSTAEVNGRDPQIAESMVTGDEILSLTPEEAIEVGYCNGIYDNVNEIARAVAGNDDFIIRDMEDDMTWFDHLLQILLNPILQSIFMIMIIGGIFVEIRTPGIGLPLITAILGAVLYFAPAYAQELAEHWEILLFFVGIILIGLELFVIPGFGICGISGILAVFASLTLSIVDNTLLFEYDGSFTMEPLKIPLLIVTTSSFVAVFGSFYLLKSIYHTKLFDRIAIKQEMKAEEGFTGVVSGLENLVGQEVIVHSDLRPGGKVITSDGKIHEATLRFGGFASKGETLIVTHAEQGRLYCEVK